VPGLALDARERLAAEAGRIAAARIDADLPGYLRAMKLTSGAQRLARLK